MKKDFNFEDIGKRMPYRMPEGYMDKLAESVATETGIQVQPSGKRKTRRTYPLFRSLVAAAAVATLFVVCLKTMTPHGSASYTDVERAFEQLSYEDQAYMLDTYGNDVFMNEGNDSDY